MAIAKLVKRMSPFSPGFTRHLETHVFAACLVAASAAHASAADIGPLELSNVTPTYLETYSDAVTGTNCTGMTKEDGCSGSGWFVTPGADVYSEDLYERPTIQTFTSDGTNPVSTEYFGYIDLVSAQYGYDSTYMYFQLNLFSPYLYKEDGSEDFKFPDGTVYGVQIGTVAYYDVNGDPVFDPITPLLLRDTNADLDLSTANYESKETIGFYDTNNDVGGTSVDVPDEDTGAFNGFETNLIKSDGYFEFGGDKYYLLYSRSYLNAIDGTVSVEFAFNYFAYNSLCTQSGLCTVLDPSYLPYLVFEATRGLKDTQNYLWNDEYNASEAGSPYGLATQNIYELDNMRTGFQVTNSEVPEPASLLLLGGGLAGLAAIRRRNRRSPSA